MKSKLTAVLLTSAFSVFFLGCEKRSFILTFDTDTRPIISCIEASIDMVTTISISMNCQKSIAENIFLCSADRILKSFDTKEKCEAEYEYSIKTYGKYDLKLDRYNQPAH